ncbi:MAG: right-handed parallel beta-helix repeat-containing protein, partial [Clostridia bacterium]|nr:right-handed parallel beta-helix repeat-containing protein [Clostridia bacterium]
LDKKNRKVYYAGNASEALVPTISTLMEIKADDVRIVDGVFSCTKGEHESIGIDGKPRASDPQSVCDAGGAIVFSGAKNCVMTGCTVSGVGLYGVEIGKGCRAVRIENCAFNDLGAGGIKITGGAAGEPEENVTSFCAIRGCEIAHTGARYLAGCGVLARDTSYLEVSDCRIHHTGYSGISVGWVWGYADSATFGCRIARNHIHDIGTGELSDLAGIYLLGTQRGTVIEYNRIHRIRCADYLAGGIYTDEGSGYVRIENNVVFDAQTAAFFQHYGQNNVVENNVFALSGACADIAKAELHRTVVFQNNLCLCDGVPVFGKQKGTKTLVSGRNLFFDRKGKLQVFEGVGLDDFKNSGRDRDSEEADPGFADPEGGDFTLCDGSPAEKLGFKPIKGFPATE